MKYSEKWDFPEKNRKKKLRMAAVSTSANEKKYRTAIF